MSTGAHAAVCLLAYLGTSALRCHANGTSPIVASPSYLTMPRVFRISIGAQPEQFRRSAFRDSMRCHLTVGPVGEVPDARSPAKGAGYYPRCQPSLSAQPHPLPRTPCFGGSMLEALGKTRTLAVMFASMTPDLIWAPATGRVNNDGKLGNVLGSNWRYGGRLWFVGGGGVKI